MNDSHLSLASFADESSDGTLMMVQYDSDLTSMATNSEIILLSEDDNDQLNQPTIDRLGINNNLANGGNISNANSLAVQIPRVQNCLNINSKTVNISKTTRRSRKREILPQYLKDSVSYMPFKIDAKNSNDLIGSIPIILCKFDALFPFYRLKDYDCKELSQLVLNEIDIIDKIFCFAKGRLLEVKIYYYGEILPKIVTYFNDIDSAKEVSEWNDIIMDDKYCLKELGLLESYSVQYSATNEGSV